MVVDGVDAVSSLVNSGFVPVMHGDCVIDRCQGCFILSGDTLIKVGRMKQSINQLISCSVSQPVNQLTS